MIPHIDMKGKFMTPDQFKATRKSLSFTQAKLAKEWGVCAASLVLNLNGLIDE